jgi:hypothetical protein
MLKISQKRLKELLSYNSETGVFTWKENRSGKTKKGMVAGYIQQNNGYRRIRINNVAFRASRLAWLYVHGYLPENDVDHINNIRSDDRIVNLREATRSCNLRNHLKSKRNKSGVSGVCYHKRDKKWIVNIGEGGRLCHVGCYKNFQDAVLARLKAEKKYGYESCRTESTAKEYIDSCFSGVV